MSDSKTLGFGKHKDKTYKQAMKEEKQYCEWLLSTKEKATSASVKAFIEYLEKNIAKGVEPQKEKKNLRALETSSDEKSETETDKSSDKNNDKKKKSASEKTVDVKKTKKVDVSKLKALETDDSGSN